MENDRELQQDVLDELTWEPGVKATDIGVTVKDGVVTLEGTVDSFAEKWAAEKAVKRLSGVKALAVEIEVKLPGSSERSDADIARAAENALDWDVSVPYDRIKVTAERGFLTLEGEVDWEFQRSAAEAGGELPDGCTGSEQRDHHQAEGGANRYKGKDRSGTGAQRDSGRGANQGAGGRG